MCLDNCKFNHLSNTKEIRKSRKVNKFRRLFKRRINYNRSKKGEVKEETLKKEIKEEEERWPVINYINIPTRGRTRVTNNKPTVDSQRGRTNGFIIKTVTDGLNT